MPATGRLTHHYHKLADKQASERRLTFRRYTYVLEGGSTIHTDEWWGYRLVTWAGYDHRKVRHGKGEYARNGIHTNSIENFWARLKLSIRGTHIHVSKQHLAKYLGEFAFRYNHRNVADQMFARLIGAMA